MKKKSAYTIIEMLFSSTIFGMLAVIGLSAVTLISWTLFTGQTEGTNRTTLNETVYYITREVQSAEGIRISDDGKCLEIKERGSSGYNLKYSIVESYPADYLAFKDKRLIDIDADESEFLFEDGLLKLNLGTVKNEVEENQRKRDFEISVLPRSNCIKEID